jgi:hypothetical protein
MIELTIQMDPSGNVSINGPIDNTILCYGLLEVARDLLKNHRDKKQQMTASIVAPTTSDIVRLHPNGRG